MTVTSALDKAIVAPSQPAATSGASIAGDLKTFLRLLTTQLKNQDPLAPTDSTQFVTQLAMFAQAEQGVNTNRRLDTIVDVVRGQTLSNASSFLGKDVVVPGGSIGFDGTNPARFSYTVPGGAHSVTVEILDAQGRVVRSVSGALAAGPYDDGWDGATSAGAKAPPGAYSVRVTAEVDGATPATRTTRDLDTTVVGRVDEIRVIDGAVVALVSGKEVPVDAIAGVSAGPVRTGSASADASIAR